GDAFGLHHEIEDAAMLAGGEVVVKAFLVVDGERRRLLLLERRQALPLASGLLQFHAAAHDFRNRKPGLQLIEKFLRKAHFSDRRPIGHGYRSLAVRAMRIGCCPSCPQAIRSAALWQMAAGYGVRNRPDMMRFKPSTGRL